MYGAMFRSEPKPVLCQIISRMKRNHSMLVGCVGSWIRIWVGIPAVCPGSGQGDLQMGCHDEEEAPEGRVLAFVILVGDVGAVTRSTI